MDETAAGPPAGGPVAARAFADQLRDFRWRNRRTALSATEARAPDGAPIPPVSTFLNEFWTSRQRAAHSLHEVSYRACFKPQLPRFFIERLTRLGAVVYDPFQGRGTTLLEAALLGRIPFGCDVNPLSAVLLLPRLDPPTCDEVARRLAQIDVRGGHRVDRWIRMVAVNRLTGHSPGFFSVYTLPPNQATSIRSQQKINEERGQVPSRRSVPTLVLTKTRALLKDCTPETRRRLTRVSARARVLTGPAAATAEITPGSVDLVVTSPPFLDVVDYAADNWLRCWFCGIDPAQVPLTMARRLGAWQAEMTEVFRELARVLKPGGHVAFEVGEVRGGAIRLEESVIPCRVEAGLRPELVLVNSQRFTKTANVWGVSNNVKGTNSNRVVLFTKSDGPA